MIRRLLIRNLILIEEAVLEFGSGLNILTGETGSGKSAILAAIGLVLGRRADTTLVRKGVEKAYVEASFEINEQVGSYLETAGIEHCDGDELIISRELHASGKGRAFINSQAVPSALLKSVGELLVGVVSQHANQNLTSLDYHRNTLDLFGGHLAEASAFKAQWEKVKDLSARLIELKEKEGERLIELKRMQEEIEEIREAHLTEGEDEELFAEYSRLINVEEIALLCHEITQTLDEGVFIPLNSLKRPFEKLVALDSGLTQALEGYHTALCELQECSFAVQKAGAQKEYDPGRLTEINDRLAEIQRLKKKYNKSVLELIAYEKHLGERVGKLQDLQIEDLEEILSVEEAKLETIAQELSALRAKTALEWQGEMTEQLKQLNMPHARFIVQLTKQKRGSFGDEAIEFYLAPNFGENPVSVRECVSGGEMARVMLAIQALLGGKEQMPTLLFDEIDANIGGETAVVVGEKLKEIACAHQVLCITHFPQVARQADEHFRIRKQEVAGRTLTLVDSLFGEEREEELQRMLGNSVKVQVG